MSSIYLPDTNAVSRAARGNDAKIKERFHAEAERIHVSSMVWFELVYGAEKAPNLPQIAKRLERLREIFPRLLPFSEDAAWHAARVRVFLEQLRPNAKPIGPYDVLVAGHALSIGAVLVTHNVNEFRRVPGLRVEDWQTV